MYCHNAHVKIMDFDGSDGGREEVATLHFDGPDGGRDEVASLHFDGIDSDTLDNVISSVLNDEYSFFDSAIAEVTFTVEP